MVETVETLACWTTSGKSATIGAMRIDDMLRDCPDELTPLTVSRAIKVNRRTVINWLSREVDPLPGVRLPGGWQVDKEDLRTWLKKKRNTDT